jgi:hypothetical protein
MFRLHAYAILLLALILTACAAPTLPDVSPNAAAIATAVAANQVAAPDPTATPPTEPASEMIFDLLEADGRFTTLTSLLVEIKTILVLLD